MRTAGGGGGSSSRARGAANTSQKRKRRRCSWARDTIHIPPQTPVLFFFYNEIRRPETEVAGGADGGRAETVGGGRGWRHTGRPASASGSIPLAYAVNGPASPANAHVTPHSSLAPRSPQQCHASRTVSPPSTLHPRLAAFSDSPSATATAAAASSVPLPHHQIWETEKYIIG